MYVDTTILEIHFKFGHILGVWPWVTSKSSMLRCYNFFFVFSTLIFFISALMTVYNDQYWVNLDPGLYFFRLAVYALFFSFSLTVLYGIFCGAKYVESIMENINKIDNKLGLTMIKYQKLQTYSIQIICILYYSLANYLLIFQPNLYTILTSIYRAILFSQMTIILTIFWFFCQCLKKRYDKLNKILLLLKYKSVCQIGQTDMFGNIKIFKVVYLILHETNLLLIATFEKFILNIFLTVFFNSLWRISYISFSTKVLINLYIVFFTNGVVYMVSLYFIGQHFHLVYQFVF